MRLSLEMSLDNADFQQDDGTVSLDAIYCAVTCALNKLDPETVRAQVVKVFDGNGNNVVTLTLESD